MLITDIVARVNRSLAGEMLQTDQVKDLLDEVIDEINSQLNTIFPVISEWPAFVDAYNNTEIPPTTPLDAQNYTAFPEKYIRTVLVQGAAYYFYINDEEGENVAPAYRDKYFRALYTMTRDYSVQVPEIFIDNTGGYTNLTLDYSNNTLGVEVTNDDISI